MSDLLHRRRSRHYTREQLDALMAYSASLGATRHEWVADTWLLDEDLGGNGAENGTGFDFLAEVTAAAHRHGLRLDVVFKPLEGFMPQQMTPFPETFPQPDGIPLLVEHGGIHHSCRSFLTRHPQWRVARAEEKELADQRIHTIELLKEDGAPARFGKGDIEIHTSTCNGGDSWIQYQGPFTYVDSTRCLSLSPRLEEPYRVISLTDLHLPDDTRYVRVHCRKNLPDGDFRNENRLFMTLLNRAGEVIPTTPASRPLPAAKLYQQTLLAAQLGLSRYLKTPELQALLRDEKKFLSLCSGAYLFKGLDHIHFDGGADAVVSLGAPQYITGSMHPIYPEVRQNWLELIQYCLDRGVDGINIRTANHNRTMNPWEYGFNPPVVEQMEHPNHHAEAGRINGRAFTQFLREARDTIHAAGKEIGVHVNVELFTLYNQPICGPVPLNFHWEWETWIREIVDYVEFRGAGVFRDRRAARDESLRYIIDQVGLVAREAGKPLMLQSTRMTQTGHFDGPTHLLEHQMQWVKKHPDITIYNLYETVAFTRLEEDDQLVGSPAIAKAVKEAWRAEK